MTRTTFLLVFISFFATFTQAQNLTVSADNRLQVYQLQGLTLPQALPFFSIEINGSKVLSSQFGPSQNSNLWQNKLSVKVDSTWTLEGHWEGVFWFRNIGKDTVILENFVPFGGLEGQVFITGLGKHRLSRAHLFRSGFQPVNVILPDNAWELGFSSFEIEGKGFAALARRKYWDGAIRRRFETVLPPGASVTYRLYLDRYDGTWQEGLRKVFQEKFLYDLDTFDNSLYERKDLAWIRKSYAMHLLMAWDKDFYTSEKQQFTIFDFEQKSKKWFGGNEVIGIWPTWPTLGLDQRNQWDLFRDLPGGLEGLADIADSLNSIGTKLFISYNPWDESTRLEGHLEGMAQLIRATHADGVVLDTKGSSSREIQAAADGVRPGVAMYSEGMAVPKDMPGIVSGRVHNALYYPPMLNLNKLIKPDFAIFRVAELAFDRIRREYALSLFNGYGTELNIFRPGRPEWMEEDYRFFGQTLRVLRENHSNFIVKSYTPLLPTLEDGIFVNHWPQAEKEIFTVFSLKSEGFIGNLLEVPVPKSGWHYVDLWNHQEVKLEQKDGKFYLPANVEAFHKKWLGTNNEGAVSAIAYMPDVLEAVLVENVLHVQSRKAGEIRIWAGHPAYDKDPIIVSGESATIDIRIHFGDYEGKFVIQLMDNQGELLDEEFIQLEYGVPRLVSVSTRTNRLKKAPKGMVEVPAGVFEMKVTQGDQFIPYPVAGFPKTVEIPAFYIDQFPATNAQFLEFLRDSGYKPKDPYRFLVHWVDGKIPVGQENFPVVNVSYEDAQAYAAWAGKRLPTEAEWQYAASAGDGRDWPWDAKLKVDKRTEYVTNTLTVEHLDGLDSAFVNLGNGRIEEVGSRPKGKNPWGLQDLVGSVWQMTNDLYDSGTSRLIILKGGSFFKPSSSWWYVQGGPRETHYRQMLLRVSEGFERNATVGFRCVVDKE